MDVTAFSLAFRFLGLSEEAGKLHNSMILAMLQGVNKSVTDDETAWCSAFVNHIAWLLKLPQSRSLAARSWLNVGRVIPVEHGMRGFDICILSRGVGPQPGPEVIQAPGHVGFYSSIDGPPSKRVIELLGGNQGNKVSLATFPIERVIGTRRLFGE
jgi:uncharacterized protein (TIGR02594 family)